MSIFFSEHFHSLSLLVDEHQYFNDMFFLKKKKQHFDSVSNKDSKISIDLCILSHYSNYIWAFFPTLVTELIS